jgi:hypothetical protein
VGAFSPEFSPAFGGLGGLASSVGSGDGWWGGVATIPPIPTVPSAVPVLTIITNALQGHNIYAPGEPIKIADAETCRSHLNMLLDAWNADGQASIAEVYSAFVTTDGLQPHTIGPTGTWGLPVRPVAIEAAALVVGDGQLQPIRVHDDPAWWIRQSGYAAAGITDLYYSPDVPNGQIFFQGPPAGAVTVILMTRTPLAKVLLTQAINFAPGCELALTLTLMEAIAEPFHATISAALEKRAGKARGVFFGNNLRVPSLSTRGLGLPGSTGGWWDYRSGTWR